MEGTDPEVVQILKCLREEQEEGGEREMRRGGREMEVEGDGRRGRWKERGMEGVGKTGKERGKR